MKYFLSFVLLLFITGVFAQNVMSPELLWTLGRVNGSFVYNNGNSICYNVTTYDLQSGKRSNFISSMGIDGKGVKSITLGVPADNATLLADGQVLYTADGKLKSTGTAVPGGLENAEGPIFSSKSGNSVWSQSVKIDKTAADLYPEYKSSTARIYDDLIYRHWTEWEDGEYNHIFVGIKQADGSYKATDIMAKEPFDAPTKPYGGSDEYTFNAAGTTVAYVSIKKSGKEYAQSTNSDIYFYDIASGKTTNFTLGMMGYDKSPSFAPNGTHFAWTSMPRDGYEADKNSLWVADLRSGKKVNITQNWDGTVEQLVWTDKSDKIYFVAPMNGLTSLFEAKISYAKDGTPSAIIRQITNDEHD